MARDYHPEIAEAVNGFLDGHDWNYTFDAENGLFRFGVNLPGKLKNIQYLVRIGETDYTVYAVSPVSTDKNDPEELRRMAEFVCRANYGLKDGNFELDFRDGELRFKCYMNCHGILPTVQMIGESIACPSQMFRFYGNGILQILFQGMSAEDAVELCENSISCSADEEEEDASSRLIDMLHNLQEDEEELPEDPDEEEENGVSCF